MIQKINKIIAITVITVLMLGRFTPSFAFEAPTPPAAPQAPTAPTPPPQPSAPTTPSRGESTPPVAPTPPASVEDMHKDDKPNSNNTERENKDEKNQDTQTQEQSGTQTQKQGINDSENIGDTVIKTGDAVNTATLTNLGNNNLSQGGGSSTSGGATVTNDSNGPGSTNSGAATLSNSSNTNQTNGAQVESNLNQATVTGQNTASQNLGNTSIHTGSANTTGTLLTNVNTNVDGVAVAEFNVIDNHRGDLVLDFEKGCLMGCGGNPLSAKNISSGPNSTNTANVSATNSEGTFQTNEATIESTLTLAADSGNNDSSKNNLGNTEILTGDANVSANALTFANNNIAGNVAYAVVNIFENLVGDIIIPDNIFEKFGCTTCNPTATTANTQNGPASTNLATLTNKNTNETFQFNKADIENNLILDAITGENEASKNNGGDNTVDTGNTDVNARVLNVANSNIDGKNWWLAIINRAGQWFGKILGAPDGSTFAGSKGTEFGVNDNGEITAVNSGNGDRSLNSAQATQNSEITTVQENNAKIVNKLNLSANTGKNTAVSNNQGDTEIKTGDAKIIANLVNFVNNNIVGNGKLFVTVINVFKNWTGDLITPGQKKEKFIAQGQQNDQHVGGTQAEDTQKEMGATTTSTTQDSNKTQAEQDISEKKTSNAALSASSSVHTRPTEQRIVLGLTDSNGPQKGKNNMARAFVKAQEADGKVTLKINLAWFLLVLPILGGFAIIRRMVRMNRAISRIQSP